MHVRSNTRYSSTRCSSCTSRHAAAPRRHSHSRCGPTGSSSASIAAEPASTPKRWPSANSVWLLRISALLATSCNTSDCSNSTSSTSSNSSRWPRVMRAKFGACGSFSMDASAASRRIRKRGVTSERPRRISRSDSKHLLWASLDFACSANLNNCCSRSFNVAVRPASSAVLAASSTASSTARGRGGKPACFRFGKCSWSAGRAECPVRFVCIASPDPLYPAQC